MTNPNQTSDETRLAERYLAVLADVSRCARAVRDGDWAGLANQADTLARRAAQLTTAASSLAPDTRPRAAAVVDLVCRDQACEVARMLHPYQSNPIVRTTMTDPFTHPGARAGRC